MEWSRGQKLRSMCIYDIGTVKGIQVDISEQGKLDRIGSI